MDVRQFTILTLLVVPFALIIMLALLGKFLPAPMLRRRSVQAMAAILFLGVFAVPIGAIYFDGQGEFFADRRALVADGLGLPADVAIAGQRGGRLDDCWSNQVNWSPNVKFGSDERVEAWFARAPWREPLVAQIAAFFSTPAASISIR